MHCTGLNHNKLLVHRETRNIHAYTRINPFARNIETHPYRVT